MIYLTRLRPGIKGVMKINTITAIVIAIVSNVAAHYIIKWLDKHD